MIFEFIQALAYSPRDDRYTCDQKHQCFVFENIHPKKSFFNLQNI